jgi:hypothetical protein
MWQGFHKLLEELATTANGNLTKREARASKEQNTEQSRQSFVSEGCEATIGVILLNCV